MTRKVTLLVAAIGTAGIAGTAVVSSLPVAGGIFALTAAKTPSSSSAPSGRGALCQAFLKNFSANLGVSTDRTTDAYHKAVDKTIDDAVKAGKLTASQGAELKARMDKRPVCAGFHGRDREGHLGELRTAYISAAASALHLTTTQLQTDLKNGQSLSQVAQQQGVSESQFRSSVIATLKPKLDAAVAAKTITTSQRDRILEWLQNRPLPLWNRHPDRFAPGTQPGQPSPSTSTSASPAV